MALPQQVQAALDAAEATLAATNGNPQSADPQLELAQDGNNLPQPDLMQQTEPLNAEVVEPPAPAPVRKQPDEWESRYKSLQGIFNKQVPELQAQVKTLQSELSTAINRLNEASREKETEPATTRPADPKDIENFGADMVEMVSRVAGAAIERAARVFDGKVQQFEQQLAQMQQAVQGTTQQVALSAEQVFFDRLTKAVPSWEKVNTDSAFLAWLAEADPVYGINRQVALQRARETLNADHAAAVFNAFLGPQAPAAKQTDPLERQVTPRGAATVTPTQTEKPVFTQAQIVGFYDDVRRGRYRGKEAEAARLETVINSAISEGRVR
jgi:uncharacterized protein YukE